MKTIANMRPCLRAPYRALLAVLFALMVVLGATGAAFAAPVPIYQTVDELEGATIAYLNGSVFGLAVAERIDGTKEVYYPSLPDCVAAVKAGKADAVCALTVGCELAINRSGGGVALLPERIKDADEAFFFKKDSALTEQFNQAIRAFKDDGTLDALEAKWVSADDAAKTMPEQDWDAPNGTLVFGTPGVLEPLSYPGAGGKPMGYDIELALLIAEKLGYRLEIQMVALDALVASVASGKIDFGGTVTATPERREAVDFCDSVMDVGIGLIVKAQEGTGSASVPEYTSFDELAGKRFGDVTGSVYVNYIEKRVPSHGEIMSFNSPADLVAALKSGKIDGFALDDPMARLLIARNDGITLFPEDLVDDEYGYIFRKGSSLVPMIDEVLKRFWEDGTIDALHKKWIDSSDDDAKTMPEQDWEAPNGTLAFACAPVFEPMCYSGADDQIMGYDVELALLICKELGYHLEFESYTTDAIVAAVESGKADFGGDSLSITEERKQKVDFSIPNYHGAVVLVVRDVGASSAGGDFFANLRDSFERTFITENRWQMVLSGLCVTALITLGAAAIGIALGFALTFLRRGNPFADKAVRGFQTLMSGLPIVVVLMILYYVVFGSIDVPGALVAILGFGLSFAAAASANIWNSVRAVDSGQDEAALALGYSAPESFRKVVLPQAAKQFTPLLLGQVVNLIKETSIVGYIAVQDLTRASDLIRSRTMEAFFPLFATAAIYFAICWIVRRIGSEAIKRWDPEERPRTIEGVRL